VDIPRFAQLYLQGRLDLDSMVCVRLPFSRINEGFARLRRGGVTRVVVDMAAER
jgi:S-(hydroxymethyl)glutathione dehydrogenase / alcohol dehydrogenase